MAEIICRICNERTLETTDQFDSTRPCHGGMLRLKQEYRDHGWGFCDTEFPTEDIAYDNLTCPACGGWLCDSKGFVKVDGKVGPPKKKLSEMSLAEINQAKMDETIKGEVKKQKAFVCPVEGCGKSFDIKIALIGHMRSHQKKVDKEG